MDWKNRVVMVTGATGFIGSHLLKRLVALGANVHAVSRAERPDNDGPVRWVQLDLADARATDQLVSKAKPEIVFHLASLVTGGRGLELVVPTLQANLVGAVNLMTAISATGCERLILAGSMEEPDPGQEAHVPSSPYAAAKWACSGYAQMFHALYRAPIVTARIFMVYGPDQKDHKKLIPYVTQSLLRGEQPQLMSGERPVDWIYVDDVVDGLLAIAVGSGLAGKRIDLGSGVLIKVREVVETLCRISGTDLRPKFGAVADRAMEQVRVADLAGSRAAIAWAPQHDLEEGLRMTYRWYAGQSERGSQPR